MRAIEAETFAGYGGLRQIELPKSILKSEVRSIVFIT